MISTTCCFSGHRKLPKSKIEYILHCLNHEIDLLISHGITDFISGGALGFDQIAASLIIAKKEMGADIHLLFALPCHRQEDAWTMQEQQLYRSLLQNADAIHYVSQHYSPDCMKRRNQYMVDHASHCLCALLHKRSGTGQTIRYAQAKGLHILNVAMEKI